MSIKRSVFFVLAAVLIVASSGAQATISVTVRPDGDQVANAYQGFEQQCTNGWLVDTYNLGWGALCPWGGATFNTDQTYSGRHFPSGYGAFYATCDFFQGTTTQSNGQPGNPSTVWLGTNTWNGQPLAGKRLGDITEMNYWSFTDRVPQRFGDDQSINPTEAEWWNKNTWWGYVQQPILLELYAEAYNPITNEVERRQFWYRADGGGMVGDDGARTKGQWQQWNCITSNYWYSPQYDSSIRGNEFGVWPSTPNSAWQVLMNSSPATLFPADQFSSTVQFKDWTLVDPSNTWKSGGWTWKTSPPGAANATGTGLPLNFHVGARRQLANPLWLQGGSINWVNNTYGFRGLVDGFTLGFNGTSVAFDFEPAADEAIGHFATAQKSLVAPMMGDGFVNTDTKKKHLFRVAGTVTRTNQGAWDGSHRIYVNSYFVIEDGSNLMYTERWFASPIWVSETKPSHVWVYTAPRADGLSIWPGDYVAVTGYAEELRFTKSDTPIMLWSTPSHIINYSDL